MKSTENFKKVILAYLQKRAAEDPLFAVTFAKPDKNIDDCINHIINTVQKSGCNGFEDQEIYSMAVHYYDEDGIEYSKQKKRFFGLKMTDGSIDVVVLDTVKEFFIEGNVHQHCVFTNEYYKDKNSLILSARKGEQRIATIEVDLKKCSIVQCRGFQNQQPEEYESILSIVNKNMQVIRKLKRVKAA